MNRLTLPLAILFCLIFELPKQVSAHQPEDHESIKEQGDGSETYALSEVTVEEGRIEDLVGATESASVGKVGQSELEARPILRIGEILETVPGLIVTQHSGTGKANQYFLRGFNLDHGTDFRTEVEGMPVNMPTHAHGQGYTDINFVMPELVDHIHYQKGVYYAENGDFSSAGSAEFHLMRELSMGIGSFSLGTDQFLRGVAADSVELGTGTFLLGVEASSYKGPWDLEENFRKGAAIMRYTIGNDDESLSFLGMAYRSTWNSSDQIPDRAVESGLIDRFGNIDPTDGGNTSRYSLSASWDRKKETEQHSANIYVISYRLNLFSNFTYFLDDQESGDQFEQADRRTILGGATEHGYQGSLFGKETRWSVGFQTRADFIPQVALYKTRARERLSTTRDDDVRELTAGVYLKNETTWHEKLRSVIGVRGDVFSFNVESSNERNSGDEFEGKISPKGSLVFGPWYDTELYLNGGLGFHSSDARGTTIRVNPVSGEDAERVDPLVLSKGGEVGVRTAFTEILQSTVSLWMLDLNSELLFVGDAGSTEASRKSRRVGVEFANYYRPISWLAVDLDYSLSRARFEDFAEEGDYIPGSIEQVLATGITLGEREGLFGALRMRYFGPRPLIEDNSVRSNTTTLFNARAGYGAKNVEVALEVLNLFNSADHDIDYLYQSRLPGETADGKEDVHFHPVEPTQLRVTLTYRY